MSIEAIKNYILYLKRECFLSVTLHPLGEDTVIVPSELISFNIHENSYCVLIKTNKSAHCHCVERQEKFLEKCKEGAFSGVCYAGVREFVYPINNGERVVGFISVSGYKAENGGEYISSVSEKYGILKQDLTSAYESLKSVTPEREYVDTLIKPLCDMLELEYLKNKVKNEETLTDKIIRYLKQNHTRNINSEEISSVFGCSRSKWSREFNKAVGMSLREYINKLRVEDAKTLLLNSRLSVTEIAYSVGFSDSNYFTNIFKKYTGLSPMSFRKQKNSA